MSRYAGILMPIFSLSSKYGIGDFSKSAKGFIDFLESAGQKYWQILPLSATSFGDSPYQSPSSFAGNPYFISPDALICDRLLHENDIDKREIESDKTSIDYEMLYNARLPLLKKAFYNSNHKNSKSYLNFLEENKNWIDDFSLFMALKNYFGGKVWTDWDYDIKIRKKEALKRFSLQLSDEIDFWKFVQFKFFEDWQKILDYAHEKGIEIIGDIPIYTSFDSADVWANPHLFQLDENLLPKACAGCPPDGFSSDGQLWGNPLYNWDAHKAEGYNWWKHRISHSLRIYDGLRIDHFRGFSEYYSIPSGSKNARLGTWKKGPGMELFNALSDITKNRLVIAEDLGFITSSVKQLLKDSGFFGMKVLEFGFDERDSGGSVYLPHNYPENSVCYTGTHDNEPLSSWILEITLSEQEMVRNYLCDFHTPLEKLYFPLICEALKSNSKICIIPIGDYLGLRNEARINTPGTLGNNWKWRIDDSLLTKELAQKIKFCTTLYARA